MMLHEDKYAFLALINQIHEVSGIRLDKGSIYLIPKLYLVEFFCSIRFVPSPARPRGTSRR